MLFDCKYHLMPLWDRPKLLHSVAEQGTSMAFTFQYPLLLMKSETSTFTAPVTNRIANVKILDRNG